jgi:hypothetical protein
MKDSDLLVSRDDLSDIHVKRVVLNEIYRIPYSIWSLLRGLPDYP